MRLGFFLILVLFVRPGFAETGSAAEDAALAEVLFNEGQDLMLAKNYEAACAKFDESQRVDPSGGTLLNLGNCYVKIGRSASAWSTLKLALTAARQDDRSDRIDLLEVMIVELEPTLSKLRVVVPANSNHPGVLVELDGRELGPAAWGVPMPVDPGEHEVTASAPNAESFSMIVTSIDEGDTQTVEISLPRESGSEAGSAAVALSETPSSHSGRKTWGYVLGGTGIVATAVGAIFGGIAVSKWSTRNDGCDPGCSGEAAAAGDSAQTAALVSTIGFGVGITALAAGGLLLLTAPGDDSSARIRIAPELALNSAELNVEIDW